MSCSGKCTLNSVSMIQCSYSAFSESSLHHRLAGTDRGGASGTYFEQLGHSGQNFGRSDLQDFCVLRLRVRYVAQQQDGGEDWKYAANSRDSHTRTDNNNKNKIFKTVWLLFLQYTWLILIFFNPIHKPSTAYHSQIFQPDYHTDFFYMLHIFLLPLDLASG